MKLSENSIIETCKKFTKLLDGYMSELGILNEDGIQNLNNYLRAINKAESLISKFFKSNNNVKSYRDLCM